jgi:hypothetical protein
MIARPHGAAPRIRVQRAAFAMTTIGTCWLTACQSSSNDPFVVVEKQTTWLRAWLHPAPAVPRLAFARPR